MNESGGGWSDVLKDLISTAGSAYSSYQSSNSGFVPLQPGTYVNPQGQVVTTNSPIGVTTSTTSTLLVLGVLALVFFFAMNMLKGK